MRQPEMHKGIEFGHGGRIYRLGKYGPNWVINIGTGVPTPGLRRRILELTEDQPVFWTTTDDSGSGMIEKGS